MKIQKIQLQGYGLFSLSQFEFYSDEINLILGNNETGKSTLCSTIPAIIYGFSEKAEGKRRKSWNSDANFRGLIEIEINEQNYVIERDFLTEHVLVQRLEGGSSTTIFDGEANPKGRTEVAKEYRRLLHEEIGLPPATIFFSSSYIQQLNLEFDLSDELRRQISGAGNSDYLKALEELKSQYYLLTKSALPNETNKRVNRRYEEVIDHIAKLQKELTTAETTLHSIQDVTQKLEVTGKSIKQISQELADLDVEAKDLSTYLSLLHEKDSISQQVSLTQQQQKQIDRVQENIQSDQRALSEKYQAFETLSEQQLAKLEQYAQSDVDQLLGELSQLQAAINIQAEQLADARFQGFSDAPEDSEADLMRIIDLQRAEKQLQQKLTQLGANKPVRKTAIWLYISAGFFSGGAFGVLIGWIASSLFNTPSTIIPIFLTIFGCGGAGILFLTGWFKLKQLTDQQMDSLSTKTKLDQIKSEMEQIQQKLKTFLPLEENQELSYQLILERFQTYKKAKQKLDETIERKKILSNREILSFRDDPSIGPIINSIATVLLREKIKSYKEICTRISINQRTLIDHDKGPSINNSDLEIRYRETLLKLQQIEERRPIFKSYKDNRNLGYQQQEEFQNKQKALSRQLEVVNRDDQQLKIRFGQLEVTPARDPYLIQEDIQALQNESYQLNQRIEALKIAVLTLAEAIPEYEETHLGRLSDLTSQYFFQFTGGRYKRVEINPNELPKIYFDENLIIDPSSLSAGAKDQLYLAMRLAITDLLFSTYHAPLILDDSFVNFDAKRLLIAKKTIMSVLQNRQVLLLTCNPLYKQWTNRVVDLNKASENPDTP